MDAATVTPAIDIIPRVNLDRKERLERCEYSDLRAADNHLSTFKSLLFCSAFIVFYPYASAVILLSSVPCLLFLLLLRIS